jgi:hypothetical protein
MQEHTLHSEDSWVWQSSLTALVSALGGVGVGRGTLNIVLQLELAEDVRRHGYACVLPRSVALLQLSAAVLLRLCS